MTKQMAKNKVNKDCVWFIPAHGDYPDFCGCRLKPMNGKHDWSSCENCSIYEKKKK